MGASRLSGGRSYGSSGQHIRPSASPWPERAGTTSPAVRGRKCSFSCRVERWSASPSSRMPAFEDRYRVIAPDYPHVSTAAQLLDGLAGVLDAEGVRSAHVLGPSYGGLVAQCFVRRHPGRVRTLILANTFVPPRRMLWPAKIFLTLSPFVPLAWQQALRERALARAFSGVRSVPPEDRAFWREYQYELISRLSKAELRTIYRLGIELVERFRFTPGDLASWPGRVLILESDRDIITPEQRAELRRCYPRAEVHTFRGAGHAPWMSHKKEYLSVINEFLDINRKGQGA